MIPLDEVQLMAASRPAAPPYSQVAKARARAGLIAAATETAPTRVRLPGMGWRVAIAGCLGIALAAGLMVAQTTQTGGRTPLVPPADAAAAVLNRAAQAAAAHPDAAPRPDQFVYYEDVWRTGPPDGHGPWKLHRFKHWMSVGGNQNGVDIEAGGDTGADPYFQPTWSSIAGGYPWMATLPTNPDRLIDYWRHADPGQRQPDDLSVAWELHSLLMEPLLPPGLRPAVYRALARLPGISVVPDAVDAVGRHGIGLVFTERSRGFGSGQSIAILDPKTYDILGKRERFSLTPYPGTGTNWTAVENVRIVDTAPPEPVQAKSPAPSPQHSSGHVSGP
jgi:hypothetical protein